jgi:uncharacterized glyoxalase superfamily protein PhnB
VTVQPYKPQGYASVSVYIVADEAQGVIDFLKAAFGGEELRRYDGSDGTILHSEVRVDDTIVMVTEGGGPFPPFPVWMHVYVPDVDATYRRALAAGGISVVAPHQKGDIDRRAGVKDPAGNTWWIATQVG